jgi:hypothetical protein
MAGIIKNQLGPGYRGIPCILIRAKNRAASVRRPLKEKGSFPRLCLFAIALMLSAESGKETLMPGKKHLRGVGSKEQRQYEHIKNSAKKSGRYGKRAEEVAARTVMKNHSKKGHHKGK